MAPSHPLDLALPDEARRLLATCSGSSAWVELMLRRRPFTSVEGLLATARETWVDLTWTDWLEAFAHHPQIGDRAELARRFAQTAHLSEQEQRGVDSASTQVLDQLADGNHTYQNKFGFIFIVCATGKSAGAMLALLQARLPNDAEVEIRIAAEEQAKITALRLKALRDE